MNYSNFIQGYIAIGVIFSIIYAYRFTMNIDGEKAKVKARFKYVKTVFLFTIVLNLFLWPVPVIFDLVKRR